MYPSVSSIFGAKIQIFRILWNFPAFCGILQSIAEHFGFLRNFTEFRTDYCEILRILLNSDARFARILVFAFSLFNPRFSLKLMCHVCKLFHKKSRNSRHIACFLFYSRWWWRICFSTTLQSGNVQFPLLLLLCVSHSFQHGDGKALLFYSVMIRCRRVESRLSTFQQRENRAISQTTSSRLLLGSQQHQQKSLLDPQNIAHFSNIPEQKWQ